MLEEDYQPYQQKHQLPSFSQLESEFDLFQADTEYPLKSVRKQMQDKIQLLIDILGDIIQPTPEALAQMLEYAYLTEEDKKLVLDIFKKLNYLMRDINESQILNSEKNTVRVINEIAQKWPGLKKRSLPILSKLKESWTKELETEQIIGYFG